MGRTLGRSALSALLILTMALGSVVMWLGAPVFWVWAASQLADSSQPSFLLILLILGGIIVSMAVIGKMLGSLNRIHQDITGTAPAKREQTVWLKSMRADRDDRREHGVLGTVMAVSVSIALTLFGIWFFFLAEGGGI